MLAQPPTRPAFPSVPADIEIVRLCLAMTSATKNIHSKDISNCAKDSKNYLGVAHWVPAQWVDSLARAAAAPQGKQTNRMEVQRMRNERVRKAANEIGK